MKNSGQTAVRLTCFAIISSIEEDFREQFHVQAERRGLTTFMPEDVRERAGRRRLQDGAADSAGNQENDFSLLHYIDFSDITKLINLNLEWFPEEKWGQLKQAGSRLLDLAGCRNRVCHSRPLEAHDLETLLEFAREMVQRRPIPLDSLRDTMQRLDKEPMFVLHLTIPDYWARGVDEIDHNLPLPEFDDTGFLGRKKDRKDVLKLLSSPHPVVTIVGEGGIGKTALALRCLYDIVEASVGGSKPYDAIIWVSLKSRALTIHGAREIRDSISSVVGVYHAIADAADIAAAGPAEELQAVVTYMSQFRVLLAIDNVETLTKDALRPLLSAIPTGSKILLTSRVGLGEIELRYPLDGLDASTAVSLARGFASSLNVQLVTRAPDVQLRELCKQLFNNPLLIKWYVSAVSAGASPGVVLNRAGSSFAEVLKFCFQNLFDRLTPTERSIVHVLACAQRPVSGAELAYVTEDIDRTAFEWALNTLHQSSMLRRTSDGIGKHGAVQFALTDIAAEYVSKCAPPSRELFFRIQKSLRDLQQLADAQRVQINTYKYDLLAIHATNRDELICAAYLRSALRCLGQQDHAGALKWTDKAKELLPAYSESYRIAGLIQSRAGNAYHAVEEYREALAHDPKSAIAAYAFAQFLIRDMSDHEEALRQLDVALASDPDEPALLTNRALCLTRLGDYAGAAGVYEKVLANVGKQGRKWRVSTRDQAAECYRRWMEQDLTMRDGEAFEQHFVRALAILGEAIDLGEWDDKTVQRVHRVIEEGVSSELYHERPACHDFLKSFMLKHGGVVDDRSRSTEEATTTTSVPPTSTNNSIRRDGQVKIVFRPRNFGYIVGNDGSEYFFHVSDVAPGKWYQLAPGVGVSFEVERGPKGLRARRVRVA